MSSKAEILAFRRLINAALNVGILSSRVKKIDCFFEVPGTSNMEIRGTIDAIEKAMKPRIVIEYYEIKDK